jgi:deazaflavin-dependent oxidoreductase (nitroreductase family)
MSAFDAYTLCGWFDLTRQSIHLAQVGLALKRYSRFGDRRLERLRMRWQKLYNPIVIWMLRSPLHGLISGSTMLITFHGRKSAKSYTTPVNYVWDDHTLLVVSPKDRHWWRNLRGGAPVTVRVRAQNLRGVGRIFEGEEAVKEGRLLAMLRKSPGFRRHWGVNFDKNDQPEDRDLLRVARTNALIRIGHLSAM